jgi:hypothetical protein
VRRLITSILESRGRLRGRGILGDLRGFGERCPTALARGLGEGEAGRLPECLCLHAKRDHFGAVDPHGRFWDAWVERGGTGRMEVVRGESHNHMSTVYGVGCGDEEVEGWLMDVLRWCLEQ